VEFRYGTFDVDCAVHLMSDPTDEPNFGNNRSVIVDYTIHIFISQIGIFQYFSWKIWINISSKSKCNRSKISNIQIKIWKDWISKHRNGWCNLIQEFDPIRRFKSLQIERSNYYLRTKNVTLSKLYFGYKANGIMRSKDKIYYM